MEQYNTKFLNEIQAAAGAGSFGRLESILEKYQATRVVVRTLPNGLEKVEYRDKDGLLLAELTE